ncbi:hypothetical protein XENOCAPTIV_015459, partial [Xenoophorus captivus]
DVDVSCSARRYPSQKTAFPACLCFCLVSLVFLSLKHFPASKSCFSVAMLSRPNVLPPSPSPCWGTIKRNLPQCLQMSCLTLLPLIFISVVKENQHPELESTPSHS